MKGIVLSMVNNSVNPSELCDKLSYALTPIKYCPSGVPVIFQR